EIWATGLRNPWRFSFDRETGDLWIADVGQNRAEEINFQPRASGGGENYGWRTMEGLACFNPAQNCNRTGLTLPVHEYTRNRGDVSVTGGYVYRGARWPALRGTYIYGDYASGRIWGLRRDGALFNNRELLDSPLLISTFGEDEAGEIYVAHHGDGDIFRIESTAAGAPPVFTSSSVANAASYDLGLTPGSAAVLFASGLRATPGVTAASSLPLPRTLDGVRVTVNGRDAPLFAVASGGGQEQVNFQTPWETEAVGNARVAVIRDGVSTEVADVLVTAPQPGIFEWNSEVLLVRANGNTLVTPQAPLRAGEDVYFYATGLGPVSNNPGTGNPAPRSPLAATQVAPVVTLDGAPCTVQFAGLAPDFAGIYQVNVRVPAAVRSGVRDLTIAVGAVRSKTVRVSVQ
ncbi:MAG: PQQ-dependent sugar dehydrogenase, partial [Bryobacterales bacterium]|nr:PQQ-dependent sugar dehydrogenase [Bryobacterales bacterium]